MADDDIDDLLQDQTAAELEAEFGETEEDGRSELEIEIDNELAAEIQAAKDLTAAAEAQDVVEEFLSPNVKKGRDLKGLSAKTRKRLAKARRGTKRMGLCGDTLVEAIPTHERAKCERVEQGDNNTFIIFGRDRNSHLCSGYGGAGHTQAGAIDIVAGKMSSIEGPYEVGADGERLEVGPLFNATVVKGVTKAGPKESIFVDAARIYISQKADIDNYFNLATGEVGKSKARSAIALKADAIRVIARNGIKLVTGAEEIPGENTRINSQGGEIEIIKGIDMIAGNVAESGWGPNSLQPLVKGDNLVDAIGGLEGLVDDVAGALFDFIVFQMDYNAALLAHTHKSPFWGVDTMFSAPVLTKGIKNQINMLTKVMKSTIATRLNLVSWHWDYLSPIADRYICSRYNNTN